MKNMSTTNAQLKVLTLVTCIAGLSMGNQSCQSTTAASARILKMDVDVGTLSAQTVTLPDGEVVDFPYVANSLFYQEVMANSHFVISNPIATPTSSTSATVTAASVSGGDLTASSSGLNHDQQILMKYGFIKAASSPGSSSAPGVQAEGTVQSLSTVESPTDAETCLYDLPQATIGGEVNSFALTGGGGINVGYGTGGVSTTTLGGIGAAINYTASTLQMGFRSDDPLTENIIAAAQGVSVQSKISAAVSFPAGGVPLGLNFFYNTAITKTISAAMDQGLASLVTQYENTLAPTTKSWNDVWESRVIYDPQIADQDTTIAIRGGYRAGIQVGDQFAITNMDYKWAGDPCTSVLQYKIPLSTTPIATVTIIEVGDNVAVAQVLNYSGDTRVQSGAQVKITALYVAPTASPSPSPTPAN